MNTAIMKYWSITSNQDGFTPPELLIYRLQGIIYNDSRGAFPDGSRLHTSSIQRITDCGSHKLVETKNTVYMVSLEDVNPDYEKQFPGAYERLQMKVKVKGAGM